jgi:septal ring factor EnvC (AmiA/AmiB activator)
MTTTVTPPQWRPAPVRAARDRKRIVVVLTGIVVLLSLGAAIVFGVTQHQSLTDSRQAQAETTQTLNDIEGQLATTESDLADSEDDRLAKQEMLSEQQIQLDACEVAVEVGLLLSEGQQMLLEAYTGWLLNGGDEISGADEKGDAARAVLDEEGYADLSEAQAECAPAKASA